MRSNLRPPALLTVLLAALVLAACGSSGSSGDDGGKAGGASAAGGVEEGALPVTIRHKFGSTTVSETPKRVVVAGLREQDSLLALGVVPVATTEWYGRHPGAIFPWARAALGDASLPEVLDFTDGIQFERVAALRPDLILAVYSGLRKKDYDTLSKIAPTIAQPPGQVDWGSDWEDEILTVGKAIGKPAQAERLHAESKRLLADAAAAHPEFGELTGAVATPYQGIWVYGPEDARSKLLVDLGFTFPDALEDVGGDEFGGELAGEEVDRLDVGTLVWFAGPGPAKKLRRHPVYSGLDVRRDGRDVFLDDRGELYEATSFISVLSMPLLMEQLVPKLVAAADGDPTTNA